MTEDDARLELERLRALGVSGENQWLEGTPEGDHLWAIGQRRRLWSVFLQWSLERGLPGTIVTTGSATPVEVAELTAA